MTFPKTREELAREKSNKIVDDWLDLTSHLHGGKEPELSATDKKCLRGAIQEALYEKDALIEKLVEALEPFAKAYEPSMESLALKGAAIWSRTEMDPNKNISILVSDVIRAREVLAKLAPKKEGK